MNTFQQSKSLKNAVEIVRQVPIAYRTLFLDCSHGRYISIVIYPWQWPGIDFNHKPWIYVSLHDTETAACEGDYYATLH